MAGTVVGRDLEVAALASALEVEAPAAVVLAGNAGIGKSVLWEASLLGAEARGHRVLRARASESETRLPLGVLGDLLDGVEDLVLPVLPVPQRRALETALLLADQGPTSERAIGVAFLGALRVLALVAPVVLAVDDVQWLDPATAGVLNFAARRLRDERVLLLLTYRTEGSSQARERSSGEGVASGDPPIEPLIRLELAPLTFASTRQLVAHHSGVNLPRPLALRVYETSGGNPFFALEMAAALTRPGATAGDGGELAVPGTLTGLLANRLESVSHSAQQAVLVTASVASPRVDVVHAVLGDADGLDEAVGAGILVLDGTGLRLAHPLFGTAARSRAAADSARLLHLRLAQLVDDPEERARHRALGSVRPDDVVAEELAAASSAAARRGAATAAAELAEQAWRFSSPEDPNWGQRLLDAVDRHARAGEWERAGRLLEPEVGGLQPGPVRGWARLLRIRLRRADAVGYSNRPDATFELLDEVLLDADTDPRLRAEVLLDKADTAGASAATRLADARIWAREAADLAARVSDESLQIRALYALAWVEALLGIDPEPQLLPLGSLEELPDSVELWDHPDRVRAVRAMWRGDVTRARALLVALLTKALEQEYDWPVVVFELHLFELAIRVGDWCEVARVHDQLELHAGPYPSGEPILRRCRAYLAAVEGDRATAELAVREAEDEHEIGTTPWHTLETLRAAGIAASVAGDSVAAIERFARVADTVREGGIRDPGVFPVTADLVDALVHAGRLDDANVALEEFEVVAHEQAHSWAQSAAQRCRGTLLLATGAESDAEAAYLAALDQFDVLGLAFDAARTRLYLGTLYRRQLRRREARQVLERAREQFDELGAPLFAARAQAELDRVGGRRSAGGLTPTEQRIVDLVRQGLTNQEVAAELVVTVGTVEAHLTRIYAKCGVRSRTQLIAQTEMPSTEATRGA